MYKPSKYKLPKPVTQKTLGGQIAPQNISSPGAGTWEIALKYQVKQSKNGKFTSNYKAFETQISLRRQAPPNISPSQNKRVKKSLWKI